MPYKPNEREYRALEQFEVPKQTENSLILRGTPIVFNVPTVIATFDNVEYKEIIDRNALNDCDMSDFILNRNHGENDGTVYARTRNQSIKYEVTDRGLDIECYLDNEDERHKNLYRDVEKGRIDKMSFSFVVKEHSYNEETHTRTILKIKKLYDVSAVDFPAYTDTNITTARSFFSEEHAKELKALEQEQRQKYLIAKTFL